MPPLDFDQIKDDMALAIANAMAAASAQSSATAALSNLGVTATWDGTSTVLVSDTAGLSVGNLIRLNSDGNWYRIDSPIVPDTSVPIQDVFNIGPIPSGSGITAITATLTWNGTLVVITSDTSELTVGGSIRLDSDGKWFVVGEITPNVSVFLANFGGFTIPSGSTQSSIAGSSFSTSDLPDPKDGSELLDKVGEPIAFPVVDEGIRVVSEAPHELPSFTVSGANAITSPENGMLIFVTDEVGGAVPAFYSGAWRRVTDRSIIST